MKFYLTPLLDFIHHCYLVVEVDEQKCWNDPDDEESGPSRVEDCVVRVLPQVGHLNELPLGHHLDVAHVLEKSLNHFSSENIFSVCIHSRIFKC